MWSIRVVPLAILLITGAAFAQHSYDGPDRDARQKPAEVIEALALKQGEIIADIGAGTGYFTFRLAQGVGSKGHVYAVDISPEMITRINRRVRDTGTLNVSTILAPPDDPLLPQPVDRFFFVDVWHHVEDQPGYLELMKRSLKPGGQIVMIDFHKKPMPFGPPLSEKIAREVLIAQMQEHGFRVLREHDFLPYQYFIVFGPKMSTAAAK